MSEVRVRCYLWPLLSITAASLLLCGSLSVLAATGAFDAGRGGNYSNSSQPLAPPTVFLDFRVVAEALLSAYLRQNGPPGEDFLRLETPDRRMRTFLREESKRKDAFSNGADKKYGRASYAAASEDNNIFLPVSADLQPSTDGSGEKGTMLD